MAKRLHILWYLTNHSNDPTLLPLVPISTTVPWTTGSYSFRVNIAVASTGVPLLSQIFLAYPKELFEITYTKKTLQYYSEPKVTGFLTKILNTALMTWNLADYAPEMKISISKENPDQQTTITTSTSTEFAGNASLDFKYGLKFGTSAKVTKNASYQTVTRLSNKDLGDVLVHFGDKVLLQNKILGFPLFVTRDYDNGMFLIEVGPQKVQ